MELQNIRMVSIEEEMKSSYLDYSMSVIIGRALPDVRDGLKPVHRRVLYSMHELNLEYGKPYKKSARVVGDCIGKYHPHGDASVYDAIVRLAQDFSMRYPLADGQGNFGSLDGDPPAAMRYTEVRMAKITGELLADLEKETVNFTPNYDSSLEEPSVFPTRIPNLLLNGSSGIAVGMSTNIPPHNLREVVDGTLALIENPNLSNEELMQYIPGPDFPTGAFIVGREGVREAYTTGRGIITIRGKSHVEKADKGERESLVITEIPFQVNKARMLEVMGDLVKEKRIDGITEIRDESNREGVRVVIELKRDARAMVVLRNLYKFTPLQSSFGIIMLAIVNGQPEVLKLNEVLKHFITHRKEVVIRRTRFELRKAEERAHILEGFRIALDNLDRVIEIIRAASTPVVARDTLMAAFGFTERQAQAILDLRLQRLTGMEREKILEEYRQIMTLIEDLRDILARESRVYAIIADELKEVRDKYSDARRSQFLEAGPAMSDEDLIPDQEMVVTISHHGYIKRNPLNQYRAQNRGGRGKMGMATKEEDYVENLFVALNHDYLMIFTSRGKMYWLKVYDVPLASRTAKGKPLVNLINLANDERVAAVVPVRKFDAQRTAVMVTRKGIVKQTQLSLFSNVRAAGLIACSVDEDDELLHVRIAEAGQDIVMVSRLGKAIRFPGRSVRLMGRTARGVRGMRLLGEDEIAGVEVVDAPADEKEVVVPVVAEEVEGEVEEEGELESEGEATPEVESAPEEEAGEEDLLPDDPNETYILTVARKGFGKRTPVSLYRRTNRAGQGIKNIEMSERNGDVVGSVMVKSADEVMFITNTGVILRTKANQIRVTGRSAKGVKLMDLDQGLGEEIVAVARVMESLLEAPVVVSEAVAEVVQEAVKAPEETPEAEESREKSSEDGIE